MNTDDREAPLVRQNFVFPCSLSQQRFWFLDQIEPQNPALNVALRWEVRGKFKVEHIEQAFRMVIARHETLRTRFIERDGGPAQEVLPSAPFKLADIDLTRLPDATRMEEAQAIAKREAATPFDLAAAPLMRATMLRLAEDRAHILITVHHIVFDGWSIGVLGREVGEIASALDEQRPPNLPELHLQYGDFCDWQGEYLKSEGFAAERAYWLNRLADAPYFEILPDRPRGARQSFSGGIEAAQLDLETSNELAAIAKRTGISLFSLGFATLTAALHRFTGETDILVGTQVASRDDSDLEPLIGVFINNIVLRLDVSGNPTVLGLARRAADVVADGLQNHAMPFDQLVRELPREPDLSRPPLFSVNFIFQRAFMENRRYGAFELAGLPSESPGSLLDLNFFLVQRPDGWRASLEYNVDLYDAASVRALLSVWVETMRAAAKAPEARVSALNVIPPDTLARLASPRPKPAYPRDRNLADLFADVAARTPGAIALSQGDRQLSFGELERNANRLARRLEKLGAKRGRRVAVLAQRSIETVTAFLAIAKTGAAYVPLDPGYPAERTAYMIDDCGPAMLIAHHDARPEGLRFNGPVIDLESACSDASESDAPFVCPASALDPIYIMYTSGSTGQPKGALVPHRAVARLALAQSIPTIKPNGAMLHVCTLPFDGSTWEIWVPLLTGMRMVIVSATPPSIEQIAEAIQKGGATISFLPTALFNTIVDQNPEALRGLRQLVVGGEALPPAAVERAYAALPDIEIINGYGPTENTVFTTFHSVARGRRDGGPIPIGAPLATTDAYVVDAAGALAPLGGIGELYTGGDGVALGYHNRPELTATRFVADHYSAAPDAKLYRTGDIVRWRSDGALDFIGRADNQVKIRGYRIEPGEIEAALAAHASVGEAVVVVRDTPAIGKTLHAYISPASDRLEPLEVLPITLKAHLEAALPAHMVPATITVLRALPKTPNSKIDRRALPAPAYTVALEPRELVRAAAAPTTTNINSARIEVRLRDMWKEVLKLDALGVDDNFFALGGHSLLAARIISRVNAEFDCKIDILAMFKAPSVRALAALVAEKAPAPETPVQDLALPQHQSAPEPAARIEDWQVIPLHRSANGPHIVALNNAIMYQPLAQQMGRPFTAVQLFQPDADAPAEARSLEAIAADYVRLIRAAQPKGPYVLVGLCVAGAIAYEAAQQLVQQGEAPPTLVMIDSWAPGYTRSLSPAHRMGRRVMLWLHYQIGRVKALSTGEVNLGRLLVQYKFVRRLCPLLVRLGVLKKMPDLEFAWVPGFEPYLNQARQAYTPRPYAGDVMLFRSDDEPSHPLFDENFGWASLVNGRIAVKKIDGAHLTMCDRTHAPVVADAIETFLDGAARR